jgi:hypothetical protein
MKLRSGRSIGISWVYKSRCATPKNIAMNLKQSMSKLTKKKERPKRKVNYQASLEVSRILEPAKFQDNQEALWMVERKRNVEEIKKLMKKNK